MYEYSCTVTKVVDGDTVDVVLDLGFSILHKCRVRLYGIDTPESRTRNKDEKIRGKLASKFLQDAIDNGKEVVLRSKLKDSKGKYGRVLGEIIVDSININQSMITNHMAVRYFGQNKNDIELEIDTNINNTGINPYQKSIHLAKAVDAWRIFPRLFLSVYMFLLYYSTMWFMSLPEPSLEQSGLISIIVGAGAAWFGLYSGTSSSSKSFKGDQ